MISFFLFIYLYLALWIMNFLNIQLNRFELFDNKSTMCPQYLSLIMSIFSLLHKYPNLKSKYDS